MQPEPATSASPGMGGSLARAHELADLEEGSGIEELNHPLAGVQAAAVPLTGEPGLASHSFGLGFPTLDLLESRTPSVAIVPHRQLRSGPSATSTHPPIHRHRRRSPDPR